MNRIFLLLLINLLLSLTLSGQGALHRYEYWFDNDAAQAQQILLSSQSDLDLSLQVDASGLAAGLHTLYFRCQDSSGIWSPVFSSYFISQASQPAASQKIKELEYWFDNYQTVTIIPVTATLDLVFEDSLFAQSLSPGLHTIRLRARNEQGLCSPVHQAIFIKKESSINGSFELAGLEYWFDKAYSSKQTLPFAGEVNLDSMLEESAQGLSEGLHHLCLRAVSQSGARSVVMSSHFLKTPHSSQALGSLSALEYWTDMGFYSRVQIPHNSGLDMTSDTSILPQASSRGLHTLYIRSLDDRGMASPVHSYQYAKHDLSSGGSLNQILGLSLKLSGDTSSLTLSPVLIPSANLDYSAQTDLALKPTGYYQVNALIRDGSGMYSQPLADSVFKSAIPSVQISASQLSFCDSGTVSFSSQSFDVDSLSWNFGNGIFSNLPSATVHYPAAGSFNVSLIGVDRLSMRADTALLQVIVEATPTVNLGPDLSFCPGDSVQLLAGNPGMSYQWSTGSPSPAIHISNPGTYSLTVTSAHGCQAIDSLTAMHFQLPGIQLGADTAFCQGDSLQLSAYYPGASYHWSTGDTLANITVQLTGLYTLTLTTADQCRTGDSIAVTVHPLPLADLGPDFWFCDGDSATLDAGAGMQSYYWNDASTGRYLTVFASGQYWVELTDSNTCQSADSVDVTVRPLPVVDLGPDTLLSTVNQILLDATFPGASYLWNTGATTAKLLVTSAGLYWVTLDLNACQAADTIRIDIDYGISSDPSAAYRVYPVPATSELFLSWDLSERPVEWRLMNIFGQIVVSNDIDDPGSGLSRITMTGLAAGLYQIEVETGEARISLPVLITR